MTPSEYCFAELHATLIGEPGCHIGIDIKRVVLFCFALLCFALLCFALLCFALLCFALLCFALLCFCFALLCFFVNITYL